MYQIFTFHTTKYKAVSMTVGIGFNGPLRQYFNLYRAVSQRERVKMQACQVSKMDWSVVIRGARPSAARDRPSEAREFARGVRGAKAPPPPHGKF